MLLKVLVAILLLGTTTASLVCLYCTDAVSPADCDTVIRCGSHERCYVDASVSAAGSIRYNLGCRDEKQCIGSQNIGKRQLIPDLTDIGTEKISDISSHKRRDQSLYEIARGASNKRGNGFIVCSECCNGNLCSNDGCGNYGYNQSRGPVCYQCDEQSSLEDCSKIHLCGRGEVCLLQKVLNSMTHIVRYTTKCIGEYACTGEIQRYRDLISLIGKRQTVSKRNNLEIGGSCLVQCCKSDLCNINCKENVTLNSTAATIASSSLPTTTMESTRPHFTTAPSTLASATSQIYRSSFQTTTKSYMIPNTSFSQLYPMLTTSAASFCIYKNKSYNQGEVWQDSCRYNCTCINAGAAGFYRCRDICPVYNNLPADCILEKKPGECCSHPRCGVIANTCYYGGTYYHEGEKWNDGCKYKCTCQDGKTGFYKCVALCLNWTLPPTCRLDPAPAGKCCQVPVCPSNIKLSYPPGYVQE
ncbi:uncharacterized protein LOC132713486 isoform X2 [Ruditapes philippinarum]|nr:uncharacterized protein LOC132713486 isoform X2 [Ruditapes philippinarum]XP_060552093.1 uncharacterized protein LOC132713486 isoform X2 [Ruditapes philippinarum]